MAAMGAVVMRVSTRPAEAQKPGKVPHMGILGLGPVPTARALAESVSTNPF